MADRHLPRAKPIAALAITVLLAGGCGSASTPPAAGAGSPLPTARPVAVGSTATPSTGPAASPTQSAVTPDAAVVVEKPGWLAFDGTALWVYSSSGRISRIDPKSNTIGASLMVDPTWQDGGFGGNAAGLWVTDFQANVVYRVGSVPLAIVATLTTGKGPFGVGPVDGAVWIGNHHGGSVSRIDPSTGAVVATVPIGNDGPSGPQGLAVGLGSVWVGVPNVRAVFRIDAASNAVIARIASPAGTLPCGGVAIGATAVWMTSCSELATMLRIDPATNTVAGTVDLRGYGDDPILIDGYPWLVVESPTKGPGRLVRVDPATNRIDRIISLGQAFASGNLVLAAGSVWVTDRDNDRVLRLPLAAFMP